MGTSPQLTQPFDILKISVTVGTDTLDHLAGAEMGGTNRIIPMPTGGEPPIMDATGWPVGRVKPLALAGQQAMVIVSVLANSPAAETMLGYVETHGTDGNGVKVSIASEDGSGSAIKSMSVEHVSFSCSPFDYDSGGQAMVFQGIGWNLQYTTRTPATE